MAAMGLIEESYRLPLVPPSAARARQGHARAAGAEACSAPPRARHDATSQTAITALVRAGQRRAARTRRASVFARLRAELAAGRVRAAEPDAVVAHRLARQRLGEAGHPARLPLRRRRRHGHRTRAAGRSSTRTRCRCKRLDARRAACASCPAARRSATAPTSARGVICMPPMYINIGAYVGEGTLVDSHALVGSCAQIGKRVHLSAAAQIGGVIEPVGAMPVIIEDDVLVGGNCGVYEGAVVKRRAVLAAGHDPHRLDAGLRPAERPHHQARARAAARRARRRGRRARRARGDGRRRQGLGPVAGHAGHRQVPRRQDRHAHGARAMDPVGRSIVALDARASSTSTRRPAAKRDAGALAGRLPARRAATRVARAAGRRRPRSTCSRRSDDAARSCSPRTSTACRRSSRAGSRAACCSAAASATPRASWRRRSRPPSGCAPRGETRVGLLFVVGEERGSDGARVANEQRARRRPLPDQRRADRQPARRSRTRGVLRVRLHAHGPRGAFVVSRAGRVGDRQAARRADGGARRRRCRTIRVLGRTHYTVGLIDGGVAPNVVSPHAVGRGDVPHRRRAAQPCARRCDVVEGLVGRRARARDSRRAHAHACPASRPPCFRTRPTSRC